MRRRLRALLAQFPAPERIGKPDRYEILRAVVRDMRRVTVTADCLGRGQNWVRTQ